MNEAELDSGLPQTPGYRYAQLVADELFVAGQVGFSVSDGGDP